MFTNYTASLLMRKILVLFLLLIPFIHLFPEEFNFLRIDNTNGLSNNQIVSIFKDSRGFMWFGTNYGLNRYDGNEFKIYKSVKNDSTSLLYNSIDEIHEDLDGNLWIHGNSDYLIYDVHTEKFIRNISQVLARMGINFSPAIIDIDQYKNIYFYQPNFAVFKYNPKTKNLVEFRQGDGANSLSKGNIISIKSVGDAFWVLFQSGLIERYNEKTNSVDFRNSYVLENATGSSVQKKLFIDLSGNPWVFPGAGDRGALHYEMKSGNWQYFGNDRKDFSTPADQFITSDFVRAIAQDMQNRIWIATDHGGVNIWDPATGTVTVLRNEPLNPNSISQNSTTSLFCDADGIMWVGTYKNGVSYYHPDMFKFKKSPLFFYEHPQLENKDCNSLLEDSGGNLWIGTNGSGLLKYNSKTHHFTLFRNEKNNPASISSDIITASLEDKSGTLWFGTFMGGLNQMKDNRFIRYQPVVNQPNSLSNKSIYGLKEDDNQNIWIATLGSGVDRLDASRKNFRNFNSFNSPELLSDFILSMFPEHPSTIYLCTSLGINMLNTDNGHINRVFKDPGIQNALSDPVIYNTIVDSRNLLWIATNNGLNIYNRTSGKISYLNISDGLPSDQVVSLIEDNNGIIWAGTRNGLARIECTKNGAGDYRYSVVSFDESDGLVSNIFNQNAVFKNKKGEIYLGSTKGYIVIGPDKIRFNRILPTPRFTALLIGNEEIVPGKVYRNKVVLEKSVTHTAKLVLSYYNNNFTVKFSALSYIQPKKNKFKYQMKGLDTEWHETQAEAGQVKYSGLSQGTYELLVMAGNNDNQWSLEPISLKIVIKPPFWFSWWAFLFYISLLLLAIWFIISNILRKQKREFENEQRIREAKQMHEMDEMKFRFFTNISHEFRTPLTLILSPLDKLLGNARTDEERNLFEIIRRNANGLLDLVNQLLDFRKLDDDKDRLHLSTGDVVAFVKDICYSFTELANRKNISFSFSTAVTELQMEFDHEKLKKIIYNLLSNAFKFTEPNGKVDLSISLQQATDRSENFLKVVVSDTGCGIPEKDIDRIFERFYRVENEQTLHKSGTGVGLHIVSEYVRLHKGSIQVESKEGKGSVFTVSVPAIQHLKEEILLSGTSPANSNAGPQTEELHEEKHEKLPLMLVVDDNEDFRNFISGLFNEKYRILLAGDGEQALKLTLDKMPDLIIADVMMPKMDGYQLCREIKQDIRISHIPIILLTAKTGDENKLRGIEAGADDYIGKPFNMEMLTLKVSRILERQRKLHNHFKQKVSIDPKGVEITPMDEKFVKKAVTLVETNMENSGFLVEDLCREMGMSRVYFYKKILSLTDKTPSEFIRFIRLKRAAELLEKSQLFVNEVAYQVGFNDPKYFRKYFKDEFGVSPNEFKKRFEK